MALCKTVVSPPGGGGGGGALPLWESVGMRRGFAPHFRHLDDLFAPQIWPCLLFYSDLVGSHFEAPHFQHVDALFAPQIDQIYNFIQILLGPVLNFERRTPTDFDPECPPGYLQSKCIGGTTFLHKAIAMMTKYISGRPKYVNYLCNIF